MLQSPKSYGTYTTFSQLPNVLGSPNQVPNLGLGDLAFVTAMNRGVVCLDATPGAARWTGTDGAVSQYVITSGTVASLVAVPVIWAVAGAPYSQDSGFTTFDPITGTVTVTTTGRHVVSADIGLAKNTTNTRSTGTVELLLNGAPLQSRNVYLRQVPFSGSASFSRIVLDLSVGDTLQFQVSRTVGGGTITTLVGQGHWSVLRIP